MSPLSLFLSPLVLNDLQEHFTVLTLGFLETGIVVSELLLAILVQPIKLLVVSDALGLNSCTVFEFCLFKCFLGADLIKLSLPVLCALLKLAESLDLFLLLFLDANVLSDLGFFTLAFLAFMLCNLGIELLFSLHGGLFLFLLVFVRDLYFLVEYFDAFPLLSCLLLVFFLDFPDIGKHHFSLTLSHLLLLVTLLLARGDLVNDDLGSTFAS